METKDRTKRLVQGGASYAVSIILAVVCLLLFLQNKELKHALSSSTSLGSIEPLRSGDKVEPLNIIMLDGRPNTITYSDPTKSYPLFVFSTSCPHCEKTLPVWRSLARVKGDNCDVIGISLQNLDQTRRYIELKDVGFYVASAADDTSFSHKHRIGGVPETILIDGDGIVRNAWVGELTEEQRNEIQTLMSARLTLRY